MRTEESVEADDASEAADEDEAETDDVFDVLADSDLLEEDDDPPHAASERAIAAEIASAKIFFAFIFCFLP